MNKDSINLVMMKRTIKNFSKHQLTNSQKRFFKKKYNGYVHFVRVTNFQWHLIQYTNYDTYD